MHTYIGPHPCVKYDSTKLFNFIIMYWYVNATDSITFYFLNLD